MFTIWSLKRRISFLKKESENKVSKPGTTGEQAVQRLISKATYETADAEIEGP